MRPVGVEPTCCAQQGLSLPCLPFHHDRVLLKAPKVAGTGATFYVRRVRYPDDLPLRRSRFPFSVYLTDLSTLVPLEGLEPPNP